MSAIVTNTLISSCSSLLPKSTAMESAFPMSYNMPLSLYTALRPPDFMGVYTTYILSLRPPCHGVHCLSQTKAKPLSTRDESVYWSVPTTLSRCTCPIYSECLLRCRTCSIHGILSLISKPKRGCNIDIALNRLPPYKNRFDDMNSNNALGTMGERRLWQLPGVDLCSSNGGSRNWALRCSFL